jgi:hypothetical protein
MAAKLNAEGVPSPLQGGKGKRVWCCRTISRILTNDKYRGTHLWNQTKVVRNPTMGRKAQHPRPESEWERIEMLRVANRLGRALGSKRCLR